MRYTSILCIAGRTELDRAAAEMMAQALDERGISARVLPPIAVSQGALGQLDLTGVDVICLSYLNPQPQVYARYICRRLRRRAPHVKLAICCWNLTATSGPSEDLTRQMAADAVFTTLQSWVAQVEAWTANPASSVTTPPSGFPSSEEEQLAALHGLDLSSIRERRFNDVSRRVAQVFDVPIALVSFIDAVHRTPATGNSSHEAGATGASSHPESLDAHVMTANEVLVSEDVTKDPRFADDPLVLEKGIRFYAGAPLRTLSGRVVGSLCVIDTKPREFAEEDRQRLQELADELMAQIESHTAST